MKGHGSQERVLGKKVNVTPDFKKGERRNSPASLTWNSTFWRPFYHVKDKKVIRTSEYGFTKGKSCFTSLITFHDGTTGWRHEGSAVGVAYLDFRELREGEQDEWTEKWIENWHSSEGCYLWHRLNT